MSGRHDDRLTLALEKVDFPPADRVTDDTSILTLKSLVLEPLCTWRDGRVEPGLFARWEHDAEGRRWRFHVRPDARFHDGTPLTVDDVLAFIDGMLRSRDTFGMPWSYARYFAETRFTAQSATIMVVDSPVPFGDIADIFTDFHLSRTNGVGDAVIGTGPYRVAEFARHDHVLLDAVTDSPSSPGRLRVQAIPSAEQRLQAVRGGAVDIACGLERMDQPPDLAPDLRWEKAANTLSVMLYLNAARGLFRHPHARLAVNLAIDRQALIADVYGGLAIPASTIVSPFHFGFRAAAVRPLPYDPDRARRLLAPFGETDGLVLRTPSFMPERAPRLAERIQRDLAAVGLSVAIDLQPDRPQYAREIGAKRMGDLAIFDSSPHSTYRVLQDKISSRAAGVWWQGHEDPALEAMIAAAGRTLATGAREIAYGRCLARLNANPPWLYLVHPIAVMAARPHIRTGWLDHAGVLHVTDSAFSY